jgi:hypothetical protein
MNHRLTLSTLLLAACAGSDPTGSAQQAVHHGGVDLATANDMASTFGNPDSPGVFSCYSPSACAQTCSAPQNCCFTVSYGVEFGQCSSAPCVQSGSALGAQNCDGPEDCPSGQQCCAVEVWDDFFGIVTNTIACQAGPCTSTTTSSGQTIAYELCHPNGTSSGTCSNTAQSCIIANAPSSSTNGCPAGQGAPTVGDHDMPLNLYVCH